MYIHIEYVCMCMYKYIYIYIYTHMYTVYLSQTPVSIRDALCSVESAPTPPPRASARRPREADLMRSRGSFFP